MRITALSRISDQATLASIARDAESDSVGHAAVKLIKDQALLAGIAKSGSKVKLTAVFELEDQTLLSDIAETGPNSAPVRKEAVVKLADRATLAEIVMTDVDVGVRLAALDKLADRRYSRSCANPIGSSRCAWPPWENARGPGNPRRDRQDGRRTRPA